MKKFLCFVLAAVGVVLLSIVSSLGYNYYVDHNSDLMQEDTEISTQLKEAVVQVVNPTFTTVEEVHQFRQQEFEKNSIDSTFMIIPPDALTTISNVVIGQSGFATKESIVKEFRRNYDPIYQYIKPDEIHKALQLEKPVDSVKLPVKIRSADDDTITVNGKKFKMVKEGGEQ